MSEEGNIDAPDEFSMPNVAEETVKIDNPQDEDRDEHVVVRTKKRSKTKHKRRRYSISDSDSDCSKVSRKKHHKKTHISSTSTKIGATKNGNKISHSGKNRVATESESEKLKKSPTL